MQHFLTSLPKNCIKVFSGRNILWHLVAIGLTYLLVVSGFDWLYFTSVRNDTLNTFFFPALIGGFFVPIFLPISMLMTGVLRDNTHLRVFGWALGQAAVLGWFISSLYKAFTGRVQPNLLNTLTDSSRGFHFGFLEHGIFWGWPSSHTTVAFAMAFACLALLPVKRTFTRVSALVLAFYVGIGVSLSIHWFSEFVAGAIIGAVIGHVVGTEWKKRIE